jgi:pilus assembly protein CpaB
MNKRLGIVVLFALMVSGIASTVVYKMVAAKMGLNQPQNSQLMVASRDLPIGTLISASDVRRVDWHGYVPPRALRSADQVVGRGVVEAIYEGDPMLESRLALSGAGGGLAATIPTGMRAVAVHVDEVGGVSGFVIPGMKVDVVVSGLPPPASAADIPVKVSKIALQNIIVLSAGQNIQKDSEGKPVTVQVVNLLVTPEQAERLSLASNETKIQLVLRNPLDTMTPDTNGVALGSLFADGHPPAAARPVTIRQVRKPPPAATPVAVAEIPRVAAERSVVVEVLHGSERASARFNASQSVSPLRAAQSVSPLNP